MKNNYFIKNFNKFFILFSFIGLFIYIIIRANYLSFTHDESFSFTFLNGSNGNNTANNHLFNTYLMGICYNVFGSSEFSLRLPNVLSFILYCLGVVLLFKPHKNRGLILFLGGILFLNPFILEFFSLARGYGISLGFMMISLYFFLRKNTKYNYQIQFFKDFLYSLIFASFALFANLSMINFYISILLLFIIQYIMFNKFEFKDKRNNLIFVGVIILSLIPLYFSIERLLWLKELNQLYFGTHSLFETIKSLTASSLYGIIYPEWIYEGINYFIAFSFPSISIYFFFRRKSISMKFIKTSTLLIIMILGMFLEHALFESKYPLGRSALLYIPIYSLFIFYFLNNIFALFSQPKRKIISIVFCSILISPLLMHSYKTFNLSSASNWKYDMHTKSIMQIVENDLIENNTKVKMSNNWLFEPSINYYINSKNILLENVTKDSISAESMYIYDFEYKYDTTKYTLLTEYEEIKTILLKKK